MLTWAEFSQAQPELAAAGRAQLYGFDIGLGFLATVRPDGGPRVHPVCPVITDTGLYVLVVAGPKQRDLRRDGRYALHSETCPPPRHEDGFAVTGRVRGCESKDVRSRVYAQMLVDRKAENLWPTVDDDALFELLIDGCLLMLTETDGRFPAGPTVWRAATAGNGPTAAPTGPAS